jgi:hypothetical protein
MRKELIEHEATACRKRAEEFAGRAEQPLLLNLAAAFEDLADCSHEKSETEQNETGSNEPNDHIRQAKRERVASVLITIMMITLWVILGLFAYFVS